MKILICPDSFKGTLTSVQVSDIIANAISGVFPDYETITLPMADGGDGTIEALLQGIGGEIVREEITDPLGKPANGCFLLIENGKTAIIEMASASGLTLVPENLRDPLKTTTYGTGELILSAVQRGAEKIIVTLGGSATVDGGIGLAKALGYRFISASGNEISCCGAGLEFIKEIDSSNVNPVIKDIEFLAAADVDNPLLGERGAAKVYGPQKGASSETVVLLEKGLSNLADVVEKHFGLNIREFPGAGAAGGLGAGLKAFVNAEIIEGAKLMMELLHFEDQIKDVDLIITGEGRIDESTYYGKVPGTVAKMAKKYGKKVIAYCGVVQKDLKQDLFEKIIPVVQDGVISADYLPDEQLSSRVKGSIVSIISSLSL